MIKDLVQAQKQILEQALLRGSSFFHCSGGIPCKHQNPQRCDFNLFLINPKFIDFLYWTCSPKSFASVTIGIIMSPQWKNDSTNWHCCLRLLGVAQIHDLEKSIEIWTLDVRARIFWNATKKCFCFPSTKAPIISVGIRKRLLIRKFRKKYVLSPNMAITLIPSSSGTPVVLGVAGPKEELCCGCLTSPCNGFTKKYKSMMGRPSSEG